MDRDQFIKQKQVVSKVSVNIPSPLPAMLFLSSSLKAIDTLFLQQCRQSWARRPCLTPGLRQPWPERPDHANSHLILASPLSRSYRIVRIEPIDNLNVEVPLFGGVGLARKHALDLLILFDGQNFPQIKHSLFPMGVLGVRAGGKFDRFVAGCEFDIEPSNQCMDEIISPTIKSERFFEGQVGRCDSVQVDLENLGRLGDTCFQVYGVDQWLGQSGVFQGGIVETVNVIPD